MVEVVSAHTELRQRGVRWLGLCPFHDERTRRSGHPAEKLYYCSGVRRGATSSPSWRRRRGWTSAMPSSSSPTVTGSSSSTTPGDATTSAGASASALSGCSPRPRALGRYLWDSDEAARARPTSRVVASAARCWRSSASDLRPAPGRVLTSALRSGFSEAEIQAAGCASAGDAACRPLPVADHVPAARPPRARARLRRARDARQPAAEERNSPEGPSTARAAPCSGSTAPARTPRARSACSWSRATPTCLPCTRRDFGTPWPRWARP